MMKKYYKKCLLSCILAVSLLCGCAGGTDAGKAKRALRGRIRKAYRSRRKRTLLQYRILREMTWRETRLRRRFFGIQTHDGQCMGNLLQSLSK